MGLRVYFPTIAHVTFRLQLLRNFLSNYFGDKNGRLQAKYAECLVGYRLVLTLLTYKLLPGT